VSADLWEQQRKAAKEDARAWAILERIARGEVVPVDEVETLLNDRRQRRRDYEEAQSIKQAAKERRQKVGRAKSGAFEVAPRIENGSDWSAEGIVLARKPGVRLIWRYSGKHYANLLNGYVSHGASLTALTDDGNRTRDRYLLEGGKLSRKYLMTVADKIDEIFGHGAAERIATLKGTVAYDR
jgi:hypothetical protein